LPLDDKLPRPFNVNEPYGTQVPAHPPHRLAQHAPLERRGQPDEALERHLHDFRIARERPCDSRGRKRVDRLSLVPEQIGRACQRLPHTRIIPFKGGKQDQPDPISEDREIPVRRILPPSGPDRSEIRFDVLPRGLKQRPDDRRFPAPSNRGDPGQPIDAAPAQEADQHGFGLIVQGMPCGNDRPADVPRDARKEFVAKPARRVFHGQAFVIGERSRIDGGLMMLQPEGTAHRGDERRVQTGVRTQPVIDMGDVKSQGELARDRGKTMHQGRRVGPSRDRHHDGFPAREHPVPAHRVPHAVHKCVVTAGHGVHGDLAY